MPSTIDRLPAWSRTAAQQPPIQEAAAASGPRLSTEPSLAAEEWQEKVPLDQCADVAVENCFPCGADEQPYRHHSRAPY